MYGSCGENEKEKDIDTRHSRQNILRKQHLHYALRKLLNVGNTSHNIEFGLGMFHD